MKNDKLKITTRLPKGDDGYRTFSIRIKEELLASIEDVAQQTGRSRNELVGIFLDYAIKNCEIEQ